MEPATDKNTSNDKIEFTTPNGTAVVMKGFISGGDSEDLQRVFMEGMKLKVDPETGELQRGAQEVPGTVLLDSAKKGIELLVLSINGSSENVYEAVRALPIPDYDMVVSKVNELTSPLAKTPSSS